jgi:hypothetical protein
MRPTSIITPWQDLHVIVLAHVSRDEISESAGLICFSAVPAGQGLPARSIMPSCESSLSDNPSQNPFTTHIGKWHGFTFGPKYHSIGTLHFRVV